MVGIVAANASVGLLGAPISEAAIRQSFGAVYSAEENGAIVLTGNSQMTCPTATSGCTTAQSASASTSSANAAINNNSFAMTFIDADGLVATTNSTSADLALPTGSTVLFAYLVWGGRQVAGTGGVASSGAIGQVKLRVPGSTTYTTLTDATPITPSGLSATDASPYQAAVDVTTAVRAAGNGTYWVGDIRAATGADRYAGWSLVVAYRNPSLPLRDLNVFEGFADVTTNAGNESVSIPVSGFLAPAAGTVNTSIGFVAWEGDRGSVGDTLKLGSTTLSDAARPSTNFFDSAISDAGASVTTRNPNPVNTFGVDVGRLSANGVLANGATSTTVNVATSSEFYYPGIITTQIDLYTPSFNAVSKSVVNLSGNDPARVGDTLEYRVSYTNTGQDFADNSVLRDVLPANTTFVAGSILVTASPTSVNNGAKTDAAGDDIGEYLSGSRTVQVRVGTGATATAGGTLAPNATVTMRFRVTVDRLAAGTTIDNTPTLGYRARTIARDYTFTGNTVSSPVQPIAEVALAKTSTPTSQTAGSSVVYTVTATNNGPSAAEGVVVTDTLPTGLSYVSASGAPCSANGAVVTCNVGTIANGTSAPITINASVGAGAANGSVVNTATLTATTADDVTANNSASATTQITQSANLSIDKSGPSSTTAGSASTYEVTVTNNGPSNATGVVISDPVPAGTTFVSATSTQGTCSLATGTVTCAVGTLNNGQSTTATIRVQIGTGYATSGSTSLDNLASVTSPTPDPSPADNTDNAAQTVTALSDVQITAGAVPTTVNAGDEVVYTFTVTNAGPSDAAQVMLDEPAIAGLTVVSAGTNRGTCTVAGGAVSCTLGNFNPGTSAVVTVRARVAPDRAAGTLANSATISTATPQSTTANDSATVNVTVVTSADVSITKTGPGTITTGTQFTYVLSVRNAGPSQATSVTTTDVLPTGLTFVSSPTCTAAGQTVTCAAATLASGASVQHSILVNADLVTGTVSNTATVSAAATDPVPGNNSATFAAGVDDVADVSITKSTSPSPLVAGSTVTYTLVVSNAGPSPALGVTASDPLPAGVTYVSSSVVGGGSCSAVGQNVDCALGTMASGGTRTITINANVGASAAPGSSSNTASASSTTPADPTLSNNTATSSSTITTSANLGVVLAVAPSTPNPTAGSQIDYNLTVTNAGPSSAANTVVTGRVPDGLTPILGSSGGFCTVTGQTVTCNLGNLPPGFNQTINLSALIGPSYPPGPLVGQATIGSSTPDPALANNTSTSNATVGASANLRLTKSVNPTTLVAGATATYSIVAVNDGPSDAADVTVTDDLPSTLTPVSATASIGTCTISGQTVTCTADRIPAAATTTVTVQVDVDQAATGTVVNTASVTSLTTADPNPSNNNAATDTAVIQTATLRVSKAATPDPVRAGAAITYTINVTNIGPSVAQSVSLNDPLPAGLTILPGGVAGSGDACTATTTTVVDCSFGTVPAGSTRTLTINARVAQGTAAGTVLTNTATAASPTSTQTPGERSATVSSTVITEADLSIVKIGGTDPTAGVQQTYVLSVTNQGPSTASGVVITDPIPSGTSFVAATSSVGSCSFVTGTVSCAVGDLVSGGIVTVQIDVDVDSGFIGQTLTNSAAVESAPTAGSPTPDPNTTDNTASTTQTVVRRADISLTKTITSGPVVAGAPVTYSVVATNQGPSDATALTITDPLPVGTTWISTTATNGGSCSLANDTVTCTWAAVGLGLSRTASITVLVPSTVADGSTISNTATVTSAAIDPVPTTATATADATVTTSADVSITKTLISGTPVAGGTVRWQVAITNAGPSTASGVSLSDIAPEGVAFTAATTTAGSCTSTSGGASCELGAIADDATVTVTLTGLVSPAFGGGQLSNTASVSATTGDPDTANNTSTSTTATDTSADLSVIKTTDTANPVAGSSIAWTVTVANAGPSAASSVVVTDAIPSGVSGVTATIDASPCSIAAGTITCTSASIGAGASATIAIDATVEPGFSSANVNNTASATSSTPDPSPANNTDTSTAAVATQADVSVGIAGPADAAPGEPITWTVTLVNNGPSVARGVVLVNDLPAGLSGVTATYGDSTCPIVGGIVTCQIGELVVDDGTPNSRATVTITATIEPDNTAPSITNSASVSSSTSDDVSANDSFDLTTNLVASADVSIAKMLDQGTAVPGESVSWTITVTNDGTSTARDVEVTDIVPAAVSITSATILGPTPAPCDRVAQALTCPVGELTPGAPIQIAVVGELDETYAGATLVNTATIASTTPDPSGGDHSATSIAPSVPSANLSVGKDVIGVPIAGSSIVYRLTVANSGPSTATDVVVVDQLPTAIDEGKPIVVDDARCTVGVTLLITCDLDDLANGDTETIEITASLEGAAADVSNTATVVSATDDPDPSDNSSTASAVSADLADLAITLVGPSSVVAGQSVTYTITVDNIGPSIATDVQVADTLPSGLTDIVITPAGPGVVCQPGPAVDCSIASLASGATRTITVTATVTPADARSSIANTATVSATSPDPAGSNNAASTTTTITREALLTVTKSVVPTTLVPGESAAFQIVVDNLGPSDAAGSLAQDPLPAGLSPDGAVITSQGTCGFTGSVLNCDLGVIAAGTSIVIDIPISVDATLPGGSVTNTASVTSTTPPPALSPPRDGSVTADLQPAADLTLTIDAPAQVTAGSPITWGLVVTNDGPSLARNVQIVNQLPPGIGAVDITPSQGECARVGQTITCDLGTLAPGATSTILIGIAGLVDPSTPPGTLVDSATVTSSTPEVDPTLPNGREASSTTQVVAIADLSVDKTATVASAVPGSVVSWQITVGNSGPSTATGVEVLDTLPNGLGAVSISGAGATCNVATATCTIDSLLPSQFVVIDVSGTLDAAATAASIDNTATVSSAVADPDASDDTDTTTTSVSPDADLRLTKSTAPTATRGGAVTWTLTVDNAGPSVAQNVALTDAIPSGVTGVVVVVEPIDAATCDVTVACDLADMDPSDPPVEITITGTLDPAYEGGSLLNSASVSSQTTDLSPTDNDANATASVVSSADLAVAMTAPTTATAGTPIVWSITVTNNGPSTADTVVLTDTIPVGVTGAIAVSSQGTCNNTTHTCQVGTLAPGASATITITGTIDPAFVGMLFNSATVTSAANDPTPGNNTAGAATTVAALADLSIVKTVDPIELVAGTTATFTLAVTNGGPSTAIAAIVTDDLAPGLVARAATASTGTCTITGQLVECAIGALAPAAGATVTIVVDVPPGFDVGVYSNTATVTSPTTDADLADNSSAVSGDAVAEADLRLTKTASAPAVQTGGTIEWTISATNDGPSDATDVVIVDTPPAGLNNIVATASVGGVCDPPDAGGIVCRWATVPDGSSAVVTVTAVSVVQSGDVVNTAAVSSDAFDPDLTDNVAASQVAIDAVADLALVKTVTSGGTTAGAGVVWQLTASNSGPATAVDVVVVDNLPAGLTNVIASSDDATCAVSATTVICDVGDVSSGATASIDITGTIDPSFSGALTNVANVSSATDELDPADNTSAVGTTVVAVADLTVTKRVDVTTGTIGDTVRFTIRAGNLGPSTATDVIVTELMPTGMDVVSVAPTVGTFDTLDGRWNVGTLSPGGDAELVVTVRLTATGNQTNTVIIGGTGSAAASPNDTDSASVTVTAAPTPTPTPNPTPTPGPTPGPSPTPAPSPTTSPGGGAIPNTGADITDVLGLAAIALVTGVVLVHLGRTRRRVRVG